ncbi:STAS domain-containing protein [Patescibacteria group bacterium]|nr:STAS domain-containing protein [Patescibacteria group bacterium]MBU1124291.1 STAS domain-containing protein [Patescibacteria group bacterium]MBU1911324.1 STAS domain-containing protein [Patescibacteria group bacterium]
MKESPDPEGEHTQKTVQSSSDVKPLEISRSGTTTTITFQKSHFLGIEDEGLVEATLRIIANEATASLQYIRIDLGPVTYIDSGVIGKLVMARGLAGRAGKSFCLTGVNNEVIASIKKLNGVFQIEQKPQ